MTVTFLGLNLSSPYPHPPKGHGLYNPKFSTHAYITYIQLFN